MSARRQLQQISCCVLLAGTTLVSRPALAAGPTVSAWQTAATDGEPNTPVFETDLAIGADRAIAVFISNYEVSGNRRISYSEGTYDPGTDFWSWDETREQFIRQPALVRDLFDPSVTYDPTLNRFLAVCEGYYDAPGEEDDEKRILFATFDATQPELGFTYWDKIAARPRSGTFMDKPWCVLGQEDDGNREYYVVWWDRPATEQDRGYAYARSTDGGGNWTWDEIEVDNERVLGGFCAQPVTDPNDVDAPLYIAYLSGGDIYFLKGVDDGDGVSFSHVTMPLYIPGGGPASVPLRIDLNVGDASSYVPPDGVRAKTTPQLVLDPTNSNRMYVVYHDAAQSFDPENPPDDVDIDVYITKLYTSGEHWLASPRVRVNDDKVDPEYPRDQYLPSVTVDRLGRIHVTFYDDRSPDYEDQIDSTALPKFDFYYAISRNRGASFDNYEIPPTEGELPALDYEHWWDGAREYTGIAYYYDETREGILTTFTGTDPDEPPPELRQKAVIYSNQITDLPPPLP